MSNKYSIHWDMSKDEIIKRTKRAIRRSIKNNKKLIENKLESRNDFNNFLATLSDDITEITNFHSMCGFLQYIGPNNNIRKAGLQSDIAITEYNDYLDANQTIYNKIKKFQKAHHHMQDDDKQFISKIIKNYERNGIKLDSEDHKELVDIKKEIYELENYISNCFNDSRVVKLDLNDVDGLSVFRQYKTSSGYEIPLDRSNYNICLQYIKNNDIRKKIETIYAHKNNKIIGPFNKLIILKDRYARVLGYDSYSKYKSIHNSNDVINFLTELMNKLELAYVEEIDGLLKLHEKDIHSWDLMFLQNMYYGEIKERFEYDRTIRHIFDLYEKMFRVRITRTKDNFKWHESVETYLVYYGNDEKNIIGYLYLDLIERKSKCCTARCFCLQPACIYPMTSGKFLVPIIAIVTSFSAEYMNYQDVILLFHEMAYVMYYIFGKTKYVLFSGANVEASFVKIPALILENIFWQEFANDMFKKCYNAILYKKNILISILDQLLFSSDNFLNFIKKSSTKDNYQFLQNLYQKLHAQIMTGVTVNRELVVPIELFCCEFIDRGSQYYCNLWSQVIAADIYMSKIKGLSLEEVGQFMKDKIFVHGGLLNCTQFIDTVLGRKPSIDNFISFHKFCTQKLIVDTETESEFSDCVSNKFTEATEY